MDLMRLCCCGGDGFDVFCSIKFKYFHFGADCFLLRQGRKVPLFITIPNALKGDHKGSPYKANAIWYFHYYRGYLGWS